MSNRIADQMGGMILIEISGAKPEKLINLLMSRGVLIQDVRQKENGIILKIRSSALASTRAIAEEQGLDVKILNRMGVPVVRKKLKRRIGLWGGALVVILLLYLATSFIWFIDIEGNEKISREEILQTARSCGFYVGAFQPNINRLEVEGDLLRLMPELAYAEIKISGVKANIKVVERVMASDDVQGPCDIVARCDGVIEEILLQEGQALVQKGDAVTQGQVLISGEILPIIQGEENEENETGDASLSDSEDQETEDILPEPIWVRARGVVKARVWYESYGECPLLQEERNKSGQEESSIQLCLPWGNWVLSGKEENPYADGVEEIQEYVFHTPWGELGWKKRTWQEEMVTQVEYSRAEALEIAKKRAREALLEKQGWTELPGDVQYRTISQASDVVVRVQAVIECVEDIAQAQQIEER